MSITSWMINLNQRGFKMLIAVWNGDNFSESSGQKMYENTPWDHWGRSERLYKWVTRWPSTSVAPPQQNAWGKRHARTNCLDDFAFHFKGIRSNPSFFFLQTWLVPWNKNVSTLFQQMRNDKSINHSGSAASRFQLDKVSGCLVTPLMTTSTEAHGRLMQSLMCSNGQRCCQTQSFVIIL